MAYLFVMNCTMLRQHGWIFDEQEEATFSFVTVILSILGQFNKLVHAIPRKQVLLPLA